MIEDTYEYEGPKCPYCGRQYTADDPWYYDEQRCTEETCDACGKTFDIEVSHWTTWSCSARDSDEHRDGEDPQGLSGGAMPARAEGIAKTDPEPNP